MNRLFVILFICFLVNAKTASGQKVGIEQYIGTWCWSGGNGDSLIILLKKCNRGLTTLKSEPDSIFTNLVLGFHTYIEKGQLVESNMNLVSDTLSHFQSISGKIINGEMRMMFFDSLRDREFKGTMKLLSEFPNKAILSLPYVGERVLWEKKKVYPDGRTLPDNIVLEKIK